MTIISYVSAGLLLFTAACAPAQHTDALRPAAAPPAQFKPRDLGHVALEESEEDGTYDGEASSVLEAELSPRPGREKLTLTRDGFSIHDANGALLTRYHSRAVAVHGHWSFALSAHVRQVAPDRYRIAWSEEAETFDTSTWHGTVNADVTLEWRPRQQRLRWLDLRGESTGRERAMGCIHTYTTCSARSERAPRSDGWAIHFERTETSREENYATAKECDGELVAPESPEQGVTRWKVLQHLDGRTLPLEGTPSLATWRAVVALQDSEAPDPLPPNELDGPVPCE